MCMYINKKILINNLEILSKKFNKIPAFVLKSDAYGLGIKNIFPILLEAYNNLVNNHKYTCQLQVFVRDIYEAIQIRKLHNKFIKKNINVHELTKNINIIVFNWVEKKYISLYKKYNIIPVINNLEDIEDFKEFFINYSSILNIDVGMNRVGIKYNLIENNLELLKNLNLIGLMSHLHVTQNIVVDEINYLQKERFKKITNYFPNIKNITLASSNVLDFGEDFIYSQPRIGKALYGLCHKDYGLKEIINFKLFICQVNRVFKDEIVGYNAYKIQEDSYIGVFNIGYTHGLSLNFFGAYIKYKNSLYKIISISMEYIMVDFKNTEVKKGESIILFPNGFIKDMVKDTYYLEQLIKFASMPKKIIS